MQILQKWRNILILHNSMTQSPGVAAAIQFASLHSTNVFCEKWEHKYSSDVTGDQESSKTYIRYTVREKRAGAKKDLKSVLYNGGCSTSRHKIGDYADQLNKKSRVKPAHHSKRAAHKKLNRRPPREVPCDDHYDDATKAFFAAFREAGSGWAFRRWEQRSQSTGNFDCNDSRTESHDKSFNLGTCADRKILGLPTSGPLKIEDVKAAFRSSALKWHPDRHQGYSQADAEDKFKHCVNAYKSLCKNLPSR